MEGNHGTGMAPGENEFDTPDLDKDSWDMVVMGEEKFFLLNSRYNF